MAKKVIVTVIDDYDNESIADETVYFAIDGVDFEIDVSHTNAATLRAAFEPWTPHARTVRRIRGKAAKPGRTVAQHSTASREESAAIRTWARAQGQRVSARGRIPMEIVEAYRTTH